MRHQLVEWVRDYGMAIVALVLIALFHTIVHEQDVVTPARQVLKCQDWQTRAQVRAADGYHLGSHEECIKFGYEEDKQ